MMMTSLARRYWDSLACFLASLLLYVATAAPSVATVFDDSLEFHVTLPTLGIAHPSGYPLYTLLGKLSTLLIPFRDPAGRANLFSALAAGLAIGVLYAVAKRLTGNRPAAAVATTAFAISPGWWSQAVLAEVYALHGLLMILFIYLLLRWEAAIAGRWLIAAAAVLGLGLAHHRMIALLLPGALVFILWSDRSLLRQPRRWIVPIAAGLTPLLLYAYLPIRGQVVGSLDGTFMPTLDGTLNWITARAYSVFLTGNPFGVQRDAGFFVGLFLGQVGALLTLAAFAGLVIGWRYHLRRFFFLLLATAATVAFGVSYKVQDIDVFFIPAFMLIALWGAIGLAPAFDSAMVHASSLGRGLRLPRWTRSLVLGGAALLIAGVALAEPISAARRDWTQRDLSQAWGVYDYGQDLLAAVAPGGRVVGLLGENDAAALLPGCAGAAPRCDGDPGRPGSGSLRGGGRGPGGWRTRLPHP